MSRFFPAHCNDHMLSQTNTAIPPLKYIKYQQLHSDKPMSGAGFFRRHLARIFLPRNQSAGYFCLKSPIPPQKSNGRPLKPCMSIHQPEFERIWKCSIYFDLLRCQGKA